MRTIRPLASAGAALLASLLLVAAGGGSAMAARDEIITIEIDFDVTTVETFTTDDPLLCPSGTAFTDFHFGGGNGDRAATFHLDKLLVCDDHSGSFTIRVDASANFVAGDGTTGGWSVVPGSGTGDYVGIRGGGNIVGIFSDTPPLDLTDHYFGYVRL
jgi:hypothetical protein